MMEMKVHNGVAISRVNGEELQCLPYRVLLLVRVETLVPH
jgi:hypothetical protein